MCSETNIEQNTGMEQGVQRSPKDIWNMLEVKEKGAIIDRFYKVRVKLIWLAVSDFFGTPNVRN